jgi:hypothetical protein
MIFPDSENTPALHSPGCVDETPSFSLATLQPIHRSMGVSRSESIELRSKAGALKASFTPSNKPYSCVDLLADETDDDGSKTKAFDTVEVMEITTRDPTVALVNIMAECDRVKSKRNWLGSVLSEGRRYCFLCMLLSNIEPTRCLLHTVSRLALRHGRVGG